MNGQDFFMLLIKSNTLLLSEGDTLGIELFSAKPQIIKSKIVPGVLHPPLPFEVGFGFASSYFKWPRSMKNT